MADSSRRFPERTQKGSDRVRSFFSLFGLRSAHMERERSDHADQADEE